MADTPAAHEQPASRRPSLLPPFEPFSSPAGLPRAGKRKFDDLADDHGKYYPTPVPTSSTGILPSSPPSRRTRPGLHRTVSQLSERAPLGDVPTLDLPASGEPVLMGRSSNSSDFQLSANRHISRVHVRASYLAPDSTAPAGRVEVECLGWNGAKVHCRGDVVELAKGEMFVSDRPMAQILVDVQDTRVMLVWPKEGAAVSTGAARSVNEEEGRGIPWAGESPTKRRHVSMTTAAADLPLFASSPPRMITPRPHSPISPTPMGVQLHLASTTFESTFRIDASDDGPVKVYEDHNSEDDAPHDPTPEPAALDSPLKRSTSTRTLKQSSSTLASEPEEFSEHDEENDPIVHSFGPFGDNLLSRFESFPCKSPEHKRKPPPANSSFPAKSSPSAAVTKRSPIKNHVINQLAFSRIHSLPLSTIHSNLPAELKAVPHGGSGTQKQMSTLELKALLDGIACVGEISREGKDAAGKLLESEFYYVPEMDVDEMRRDTVMQSLGKTSIRAARKQHKVSLLAQFPSNYTSRSLASLTRLSE